MPIVFSAITPHTPILIPAIGKENLARLRATQQAMQKLEEDLCDSRPDTILIISPHGPNQTNAFTMNLRPEFMGNFEKFGDFTTKIHLTCDMELAYKIRERLEVRAPLQLISDPDLDYSCLVPYHLLTENLPKVKIIPLYYSNLDLNGHFKFGQLLRRELLISKNRVAVIASGDLSHRLTKDAPAGYSPKGKKFDKKLIKCLVENKIPEILKISPELTIAAQECGLRSIIILLGILEGINYKPQMLSYEAPFGVGYLVVRFRL